MFGQGFESPRVHQMLCTAVVLLHEDSEAYKLDVELLQSLGIKQLAIKEDQYDQVLDQFEDMLELKSNLKRDMKHVHLFRVLGLSWPPEDNRFLSLFLFDGGWDSTRGSLIHDYVCDIAMDRGDLSQSCAREVVLN